MNLLWVGAIVASYLLGAVPFGYAMGRFKGLDVREHGSGNVGATNVARVLGVPLGIVVFLLDLGKGAVAAGLFARFAGGESAVPAILCGAAAIMGHMFPIFLRFRGGRGVATGCGVLLYIVPVAALVGLGVWMVVMVWTRYVSAASIMAAVAVPVCVVAVNLDALGYHMPEIAFSGLICLLVVIRHIPNIRRLMAGTEHGWGRR